MILALVGFLLFAFAYVFSRLLLPRVERAARREGYVDRPGGRKDHPNATVYGGGLVLLAAVAVPALIGTGLALAHAASLFPPEIAVHLEGVRSQAPRLLGILTGAALHLVLGYIDDRRKLGAWTRLGIEFAIAAALGVAGVRATAYLDSDLLQIALTAVFVVFVVNATNFVDNMNGALAGVSIAQAACLLALAVGTGQHFLSAILLCLLGGLLAFLPKNYPAARMFLGDAGSLMLGFLFATIVVSGDFVRDGHLSLVPFVAPLLFLAVPVVDGCTVVISRLRRGVHPFTPGHDHLAHRLVLRGYTKERAAAVLWAYALLAGFIGLAVAEVTAAVAGIVVLPFALTLWKRARKTL